MKNDASDAKIPVGLLLPVWHPPSWKMSATGFLKAPSPLEVRPILNSKLQSSLYHPITHDTAHTVRTRSTYSPIALKA
jgi:hypothetical protein